MPASGTTKDVNGGPGPTAPTIPPTMEETGTTNPTEKEATSLPERAAREAELPKAKVGRARPKAAKPPLRWLQLLLVLLHKSPMVPRAPRKPSSSSESSVIERADLWSLSVVRVGS